MSAGYGAARWRAPDWQSGGQGLSPLSSTHIHPTKQGGTTDGTSLSSLTDVRRWGAFGFYCSFPPNVAWNYGGDGTIKGENNMGQHYDFARIESKWKKYWEKEDLHKVQMDPNKPKYYVLEMFPYPSGELHMGHIRNYSIGDVVARFHTMKGYNVLHPMGWDAFGMPAENAAIERGIYPAQWTSSNIHSMHRQQREFGLSYDWDREVATCHPEYYRWTQWLFLLFYQRGLAYKRKAEVNWCPSVNGFGQ